MKAAGLAAVEFLACVWKDTGPEWREKTAVAILDPAKMRRPASVHKPPVRLACREVRVFDDVDQAAFPCADRFNGIGQTLGGFCGNLDQPVRSAVQDVQRKSRPESGVVSE